MGFRGCAAPSWSYSGKASPVTRSSEGIPLTGGSPPPIPTPRLLGWRPKPRAQFPLGVGPGGSKTRTLGAPPRWVRGPAPDVADQGERGPSAASDRAQMGAVAETDLLKRGEGRGLGLCRLVRREIPAGPVCSKPQLLSPVQVLSKHLRVVRP